MKKPPTINYMALPGLLNESILIETVCHAYNVSPDVAMGKCRKRELVEARQIIATLALELLSKHVELKGRTETRPWSLAEVGMLFTPFKDHATVLHSRRVIGNLCETDKAFNARFQCLRQRLLWLGQYSIIKNPVPGVENSTQNGNNSGIEAVAMAQS